MPEFVFGLLKHLLLLVLTACSNLLFSINSAETTLKKFLMMLSKLQLFWLSFTFDTVSIVFSMCHINSLDLFSWFYLMPSHEFTFLPKIFQSPCHYWNFTITLLASHEWSAETFIKTEVFHSLPLCCVESVTWPVTHFHTPGVFLSENLSPEPHIYEISENYLISFGLHSRLLETKLCGLQKCVIL